MPVPADLALLRRIAAGRETEADRLAIADRLRVYLAQAAAGTTLEAVFGLAAGAGQVPWWRAEALDRRDAGLRALASAFHGGRALSQQAQAIRTALAAYARAGWQSDRGRAAVSIKHIGTEREILFGILSACDAVPSVSHIRRVLSGSRDWRG